MIAIITKTTLMKDFRNIEIPKGACVELERIIGKNAVVKYNGFNGIVPIENLDWEVRDDN